MSLVKSLAGISSGKMAAIAAVAGIVGLFAPSVFAFLSTFFLLPEISSGSGVFGALSQTLVASIILGMPETYIFIAGIGMILALAAGSDSVRSIAGYGIGTGVPSVSMFTIGLGAVAAVFGIALSNTIGTATFAGGSFVVLLNGISFSVLSVFPAGPLAGLVLSVIFGFAGGYAVNRIIGMNIPNMERRMMEVSFFCCLSFLLSTMVATGSCSVNSFFGAGISGGFAALSFMGCAMMTFRAYNSNLGADEKPDRTRALAFADGSGLLIMLSLVSIVVCYLSYSYMQGYIPYFLFILTGPALSLFTGIILMIRSLQVFREYVDRDAYAVVGSGLLPTEEELQ